jgi:hypothetical protein
MSSTWTTFDENGNVYVLEGTDNKIGYDKMKNIEELTGYEFSTSDKAQALASEIAKEAQSSGASVGEFLGNFADGLQNSAKLFKYLPILAIGYFLLKEHKRGAI